MPHTLRNQPLIKKAADKIAPLWPLQNYVAVSPLNNFEEGFTSTLKRLSRVTRSVLFPSPHMVKQGLERGDISLSNLKMILQKYDLESELNNVLNASQEACRGDFELNEASLTISKYFSSFFDNVQADWSTPHRELGLYDWWKQAAASDRKFPDRSLVKALPEDPALTIIHLLRAKPLDEWNSQIDLHLYNLKGWASYIRWYEESAMYEQHPADLVDFLAISFATHKAFRQDIAHSNRSQDQVDGTIWLETLEENFRIQLAQKLLNTPPRTLSMDRPEAQMVFCIDVRSEPMRRYIEQQGNYETFGFAGFFGIPLRAHDFLGQGKNIVPALLNPVHHISLAPIHGKGKETEDYVAKLRLSNDIKQVFEELKKDLVTSLGCVELTGAYYGLTAIFKTAFPKFGGLATHLTHKQVHSEIRYETSEQLEGALTHEHQVEYANNFLKAIGFKTNFARTVVLTGHESQTRNNHYASKLDCGACGANSGWVSSQLMAEILNKSEVRASLLGHGIRIPEDTTFYPAVHNTTTDEIRFLSTEGQDGSLETLKAVLETAQRMCQKEKNRSLPAYKYNHLDWSQTQPEWGLARNGGMIVGPRELTRGLNLGGRFFLHSYDHKQDSSGEILSSILAAPMRVAQMINAQYYFSTVDNAFFGAGTKVTHNIVGGFAAIQGNGSDLKIGLPLQSVQYSEGEIYHEPIRLQVFIHAPRKRIEKAIGSSGEVHSLCNNHWVKLVAIDPVDGKYYLFQGDNRWEEACTNDGTQQNNSVANHPRRKAA